MTVRLPMKFTEAPAEMVDSLIRNDSYVFEQKMDGTRGLAVLTKDEGKEPFVRFLHSGGGTLSHSAATQHLAPLTAQIGTLLAVEGELVLDGEIMIENGEYRVFDLPYLRVKAMVIVGSNTEYWERRRLLAEIVTQNLTEPISLVRSVGGTTAKQRFLEEVRDAGGEGVMAKHLSSLYLPGTRTKDQVKLKFVKTADVIVTGVNRPDPKHGTIEFGVMAGVEVGWDGVLLDVPGLEGQGVKPIGKCSAIGKPEVKVGDVIEIAYLYWTGSTTYQPRMVRVREDKSAFECLGDQFPAYSRAVI